MQIQEEHGFTNNNLIKGAAHMSNYPGERRKKKRIETYLKLIFNCSSFQYFGTAINCSETGMCINTKHYLSCESDLEIAIPLRDQRLNLKASITRVVKEEEYYDILGIELLNPPQAYLDFLDTL